MKQQPERPAAKRQLVDLPRQLEELTPEQAEQVLGGTIVAVNGGGNVPAMKPLILVDEPRGGAPETAGRSISAAARGGPPVTAQ
jgi:hypothetical protein